MRIFLLGGTGFIGRHLISHLTRKGHELTILSRAPRPNLEQDKVTVLVGDPLQAGPWQERAAECQAIINLVGRNIMARWTRAVKKEILESRVQPTNLVVQAIKKSSGNKPVLINANAVGYYPFSDTQVFDETGPPGEHFLARVCVAWQEAAQQAAPLGSRVVVARFAPVLAPGEGMLKLLLPMFKKGLGGRVGNGNQAFPWIHIQDVVQALDLALTDHTLHGPLNVCAPQIITNTQFTQALAGAVNRPAVLPVPEFALRLRFGELANMLSKGQAVVPAVLQKREFPFIYSDIDQAVQEMVSHKQ
ncbi:MAG: TIGR01777 family oxidoreductase [Desulfovermiculus sp.]